MLSSCFQNQITNCITGSLLSLQMLHSRSSHLSIIQMRPKLLEEDGYPSHIFYSHIFFPRGCSETADMDPRVTREEMCLHSSSLPCKVSWDPQHRDIWTLCFAQSPSFRPLKYHDSTWAEQLLSPIHLLRMRPFTLPGCILPAVKWPQQHSTPH